MSVGRCKFSLPLSLPLSLSPPAPPHARFPSLSPLLFSQPADFVCRPIPSLRDGTRTPSLGISEKGRPLVQYCMPSKYVLELGPSAQPAGFGMGLLANAHFIPRRQGLCPVLRVSPSTAVPPDVHLYLQAEGGPAGIDGARGPVHAPGYRVSSAPPWNLQTHAPTFKPFN